MKCSDTEAQKTALSAPSLEFLVSSEGEIPILEILEPGGDENAFTQK